MSSYHAYADMPSLLHLIKFCYHVLFIARLIIVGCEWGCIIACLIIVGCEWGYTMT